MVSHRCMNWTIFVYKDLHITNFKNTTRVYHLEKWGTGGNPIGMAYVIRKFYVPLKRMSVVGIARKRRLGFWGFIHRIWSPPLKSTVYNTSTSIRMLTCIHKPDERQRAGKRDVSSTIALTHSSNTENGKQHWVIKTVRWQRSRCRTNELS